MSNIANQLWNDFVSLIFPENCIACNRLLVHGEQHICTSCRLHLPLIDNYSQNTLLANKFVYEPKITYASAYLSFKKSGITQKLLHQIKYKSNYELGIMLGAWYGALLHEDLKFRDFDGIVPVPLHKRKLRMRGYNQSMAIAEGIASTASIPVYNDLLVRSKFTATQTKKHKVERWKNVSSIFEVANPSKVAGRKIILIDDVLTTGSTLASCAAVLLENGAREIGICSLAMAEK